MDIYNHGSIDMVIFILTLGHMLQRRMWIFSEVLSPSVQVPRLDNSLEATKDIVNCLQKEMAGSLLSYRPAIRKWDDVVIWILLTENVEFNLAEDLWLSHMTKRRHSDYYEHWLLNFKCPSIKEKRHELTSNHSLFQFFFSAI